MIARRFFGVVLMLIVFTAACFANEQKPDAKKGEGDWGTAPGAIVRVFDVDTRQDRGFVHGKVRNTTDHPIQNIAITIGRHNKNGDSTLFGVSMFPATLRPNDIWKFTVNVNSLKRQGYEVIGVSVNSVDLNPIEKGEVQAAS